jgi:hypothetical protein
VIIIIIITITITMSVFSLQIPCDDIFYGFQTTDIFSSVELAINKINSLKIKPRPIKYDTEENNILFVSKTKKNTHCKCFCVSAFNIKENIIDNKHNDNELIDETYLRIDFDSELHYTFKDENMYNCHERIFYTYEMEYGEEINELTYRVKFIKQNKKLCLIFNRETNIFREIEEK